MDADNAELTIDTLNDDMLHAIFTTWDAFRLATMCAVCKCWRAIAMSEDLWARACRARWELPMRSNRRPYIAQLQSRAASWLQAYSIYHHIRRPPAMQDRAVYADGMRGSVGAWLHVKHQPACVLPLAAVDATQPPSQQQAQHRVLRVNVLVQNLRSEQLGLMPDALQVTYRGTMRPVSVRIISGVVISAAGWRCAGQQAASDYTERAPVPECMDSACRAPFANAERIGRLAATKGKTEEQGVALAPASPPWRLEPLDVACVNCEITALAGARSLNSLAHGSCALPTPLEAMLVLWQPNTGSPLVPSQV